MVPTQEAIPEGGGYQKNVLSAFNPLLYYTINVMTILDLDLKNNFLDLLFKFDISYKVISSLHK